MRTFRRIQDWESENASLEEELNYLRTENEELTYTLLYCRRCVLMLPPPPPQRRDEGKHCHMVIPGPRRQHWTLMDECPPQHDIPLPIHLHLTARHHNVLRCKAGVHFTVSEHAA